MIKDRDQFVRWSHEVIHRSVHAPKIFDPLIEYIENKGGERERYEGLPLIKRIKKRLQEPYTYEEYKTETSK